MKKKIVAVFLLSLLLLPAFSRAEGKAADNPFGRIWAAVAGLEIRLTAVEDDRSEREREMENLEERIDVLTACLADGGDCALDEGDGGEGNGGGEPELKRVTCGFGICGNSMEYREGEAVPECVPHTELAQIEVCDGLDNDCDGSSDEDFLLLGAACDPNADWSGSQYGCDYGAFQCR